MVYNFPLEHYHVLQNYILSKGLAGPPYVSATPFFFINKKTDGRNFYPNGVQIIPDNIYQLLTSVALAHLIMGDGFAECHGLIICTNSYSIEDVVWLMNVLMIRYRLECTLRLHRQNNKNGYEIYIRQRSMPLLRTIVTRGRKIWFSTPTFQPPGAINSLFPSFYALLQYGL